jgi:hypothetical protein
MTGAGHLGLFDTGSTATALVRSPRYAPEL